MEKRAAYESVLPYVREWIAYKVWQLRLPGVQVAVGFEGEELFSEAWGYADVEAGRRLTTTDRFRIASHSKTFTATALLQLADDGRLRLDDTVGTFVPALVEAGSPIADATVRELMEMGGGVVRDGADGDHWALAHPFPDADQLVAMVVAGGAKVPVGSAFNYTNLGYGLLGLVIEAVTGTSYAEHVRTAIVEPLGLTGTGPEYDPAHEDAFVVGYTGLHTARTRQRVPHVTTGALAAATGSTAPRPTSSGTSRRTCRAAGRCCPTTPSGWRSGRPGARSTATRRHAATARASSPTGSTGATSGATPAGSPGRSPSRCSTRRRRSSCPS